MADECDLAQDAERLFREAALTGSVERARDDGPAATHCEACGEPIPEARRRAVPGCRLCRACQEEAEHGR